MFVKDHLQKIKDLAKSNASLQIACTSALDLISKYFVGKEVKRPFRDTLNIQPDKKTFDQNKDLAEQEWDFVVDSLLDPLTLACTSSNPRVTENALEAMLTMVEKGLIVGAARSGKLGELLAKCFEVKDDSVHMTILLTYGMLVAKPACELHEANLMTAIRISYNIFLITSNPGIQKMAKEKLTEILRTLFQRMDHNVHSKDSTGINNSVVTSLPNSVPNSARSPTPSRSNPVIVSPPRSPSPAPPSEPSSASPAELKTPTALSNENSDDDESGNDKDEKDDKEANQDNAISEETSQDTPAPQDGLLTTFEDSTNPEPNPATSSASTSFSASLSTLPQVSLSGKSVVDDIAFKDCLHAFRGLCKLSVKAILESNATNPHSFDVRSRILCLELINAIFEEENLPTFKSNTRFVASAIKKHLLDTIYCNIHSPITLVFRLTMSLCMILIKEFRDQLKPEIEALLGNILLPILDSPNAPAQHRLAAIRAVYGICKSPQCIVDLFINYDCDIAARDIFEQIAKISSKASLRKLGENLLPEVVDQESLVKHLALKTSVCLTIALVEWSKTLYEHPVDAQARRIDKSSTNSTDGSSSSSSQLSVKSDSPYIPDAFQKRKLLKSIYDEGRESFKSSFKRGIRFFWDNGICERNPKSTALFLRETSGLDKTMLGDFLGERDPVDEVKSQEVLSEYSKLFKYHGMEIDIALRLFLGTFRLPGEGQKVDRIMAAFSAVYYQDTLEGTTFGNSDAVYYLAMAIIFLTTSIHNPSVPPQDKLTKVSWKKLLLGQNAEKDYDDTMIDGIFARIVADEFKVRGEDPPAVPSTQPAPVLNDKAKLQLFLQECKAMSDKAKEFVKDKMTQAQQVKLKELKESKLSSSNSSITAISSETSENNDISESSSKSDVSANGTNTTLTLYAPPSSTSPASPSPLAFTKASSPYYADQMFRAASTPLLNAYVGALEAGNVDPKTVHICLEGIRGAIRLACLFDIKPEREAFVNSLSQFTLLDSSSTREIKSKNLEAIDALITVAEEEGNLKESWKKILLCISSLEKLLSTSPPSVKQLPVQTNQNEDSGPSIEELNVSAVTSKFRQIVIDRIFTNSSRLSDEAIIDFVSALCKVSQSELANSSSASFPTMGRTFSLQKIVEVADFNISRSKAIWMLMWNHISPHFVEGGLNKVSHVALVAVDSLRQVASKLLEKHTSEGGTFQTSLLTPFETMYSTPNPDTKDYLLCCLSKLVATHYKSIHEGWAPAFKVLLRATSDIPPLVELGMAQLEAIAANPGFFDSVILSNHFATYVQTVSKYASTPSLGEKIAIRSLNLLKLSAKALAAGKVPIDDTTLEQEKEALTTSTSPSASNNATSESNEADIDTQIDMETESKMFTLRLAHKNQWQPILKGFVTTLEQHDINVRPLAVSGLLETLTTYGSLLSRSLFKWIFIQIIYPVFDKVLKPAQTQLVLEDTEWLLTSCHKFLHGTIVLYSKFFDELGACLLSPTLSLLQQMILQNNEKLATVGMTCFEILLEETSSKFDSQMWTNVISTATTIMLENMPLELKVVAPVDSLNISGAQEGGLSDSVLSVLDPTSQMTSPAASNAGPVKLARSGTSPSIPAAASTSNSTITKGLGKSTTHAKKTDPTKNILLGKAWIQNLGLKTIRERIIDGSQPYETLSKLNSTQISDILQIYLKSFIDAYKNLMDENLAEKMDQALYDLILKQEIDSMWTYIELIFYLHNDYAAKAPAESDIGTFAEKNILDSFELLEQCHMGLAHKSGLSERKKRLHESNEALVTTLFTNFGSFTDSTFLQFLPHIYPGSIRLALSDSIKVRESVKDLLTRVGLVALGIQKEAFVPSQKKSSLLSSSSSEVSSIDATNTKPSKSGE